MISRTIVKTILVNDAGEEKIIYGNFSIIKAKREGWKIVESSVNTYEMDIETFVKNATIKNN